MRSKLESWITNQWYNQGRLCHFMLPLSWVYRYYTNSGQIRRTSILKKHVWIIGNFTVGGAGKTPLVIHIANQASVIGLRVLIVVKPYRTKKTFSQSRLIGNNPDPLIFGDEPCLIKAQTKADVLCIAKNRSDCFDLQDKYDLIIADDGLQDATFERSMNWLVVHGERGFGNGYLLPRGPLRSSLKWAKYVDQVVERDGVNENIPGYCLTLDNIISQKTKQAMLPSYFDNKKVLVTTGIGYPFAFFQAVRKLNIKGTYQALADHHIFRKKDIAFLNQFDVVIVTEKDAIKLKTFDLEHVYVCQTVFKPNETLKLTLHNLLKQITESDTIVA